MNTFRRQYFIYTEIRRVDSLFSNSCHILSVPQNVMTAV